MSKASRRREVGRAEKVVDGLWRLRLPLPWKGVPHVNGYAIASGDHVVLVDCGADEEGSVENLEIALEQTGYSLEQVKLLVCTHAHVDHYGQAATVIDHSGCQLWMHGNHAHVTRLAADPETNLARRAEIARTCGMPEEWVQDYVEQRKAERIGLAAIVEPDRTLTDGDVVPTDLGEWQVLETPGHAPSHICLFLPEQRILISGDHVLGRIHLYYDYGWTPDPVGEYLASLEKLYPLEPRLCLSGHGRSFTDVVAHIEGSEELVRQRLAQTAAAVEDGSQTVYELLPKIFEDLDPRFVQWRVPEVLAYLKHLEREGEVQLLPGDPERWAARRR